MLYEFPKVKTHGFMTLPLKSSHDSRGKGGNPKDYIAREYLNKVKKPKSSSTTTKRVFNHFTCAPDTNQIKHIFNDVVNTIVDKSLAATGLQ